LVSTNVLLLLAAGTAAVVVLSRGGFGGLFSGTTTDMDAELRDSERRDAGSTLLRAQIPSGDNEPFDDFGREFATDVPPTPPPPSDPDFRFITPPIITDPTPITPPLDGNPFLQALTAREFERAGSILVGRRLSGRESANLRGGALPFQVRAFFRGHLPLQQIIDSIMFQINRNR